jgi:PAS domain S-box-containing protein
MDWPLLSGFPVSGRHVLIVDDDRDFAVSLRNLLVLEEYRVEVACDAASALDALDRFEVEVALIDIRLEGQDGLALLGAFRQRREHVICVVMTAYASVESAIEALQRGAYDFLCKPFYPEDLVMTLERCFERLALARGREAAERALSARNQELEAVNARLRRTVSAMQVLSTSETLPSLYTTAIETLAYVVGAENAALYLVKGPELALHEAVLGGLPLRIPFPDDPRAFQRPATRIEIATALATQVRGGAVADSSSMSSLPAFPLTSEDRKPLGLLVVQPHANAIFADQDQELGVILAAFINGQICRLQAHDIASCSETRLREIVDNSPSLIAINDLQGRYVMVNSRFECWHGRDAADVVGRRPDDLFSSDVARLYKSGSSSQTSQDFAEEEAELVFQDGSTHTVLVTHFLLGDGRGRSIGVGTIATDVTASRHAEKRLRHSQHLEALGQLTSGIAHDFNNLLAIIIGNLDLLREKVRALDPNRELIDDSLSSASSGRELVRTLLSFGRCQTFQPEPIDANSIILGLSHVIERTFGDRIEMRWRLGDDLWPIAVDRCHFESSLLNLVLNARDAMPCGGLLVVETRNIVMQHPAGNLVETLASGPYVALTVSDNGTGMTPAVAAQALQPFFTTKAPGAGSGLGLAMVHSVASQSGGSLMIDSAPGAGTSVTLYLPVAKNHDTKNYGARNNIARDAPARKVEQVLADESWNRYPSASGETNM